MHLVDDQNGAVQPESPDEVVSDRQDGQQDLIDSADADLSQEDTLAAAGQPSSTLDAGFGLALSRAFGASLDEPLVRLIQPTMTMGQNQIRATKGALGEGFTTSKHGVCRGLSGEREDDRLGQSGIDQAPGVGQCSFGLAAARGGFNDRQSWGKRQVVDHDLSAARMLGGFE